ncbi:MAG TPA: TonB family protein [Pyrinomonadaceae bacterium]
MPRANYTSTRLKMLVLTASIFFLSNSTLLGIQQQPPSSTNKLDVAVQLIKQDHFESAINLLKEIVKDTETDAKAWFYLGFAYAHSNEVKKAISALETSIKLDAGWSSAHVTLSDMLLQQGKRDIALAEIEKALSLQPQDPYAHYLHSLISLLMNSRDDAVRYADLAIQLRPDYAQAHLLKAQALLGFYLDANAAQDETAKTIYMARYRGASDPLTKYVRLSPDSENKRVWLDEIEALTGSSPGGKQVVLTGKEVATKARPTSKPEPTYTEFARRYKVEGTVVLRAVFGSDGNVSRVFIVNALPCGLTERAVRAAHKIKFIPATLDGKPVSMWIQLEYNFNLN